MTILKYSTPSLAHSVSLNTELSRLPISTLTTSQLSSSIKSCPSPSGQSSAPPPPPPPPSAPIPSTPHSPSLRSVSSMAIHNSTVTTTSVGPPLISLPMPVQIGFTLLNSTNQNSGVGSTNNYESSASSTTSSASSVSPSVHHDNDSTSSASPAAQHHRNHHHNQHHNLPPQATNRSNYLLTTTTTTTSAAATNASSGNPPPPIGFDRDRPPSYVAVAATVQRNSHMTIENHYNNSLSDGKSLI